MSQPQSTKKILVRYPSRYKGSKTERLPLNIKTGRLLNVIVSKKIQDVCNKLNHSHSNHWMTLCFVPDRSIVFQFPFTSKLIFCL